MEIKFNFYSMFIEGVGQTLMRNTNNNVAYNPVSRQKYLK